VILDFYSVKFLVRWIVGRIGKLGRDVVKTLIIRDNQDFHGLIINPYDLTVSLKFPTLIITNQWYFREQAWKAWFWQSHQHIKVISFLASDDPPRITVSKTKIQLEEGILSQPCPKWDIDLGWVQLQQKSLQCREKIEGPSVVTHEDLTSMTHSSRMGWTMMSGK
jgi:hypothetical protein